MKKYLLLIVFGIMAWSVQAQQASGPAFKWETPTHDFGDIYQGDKVEYVYKFTNVGNEPIIITNVQVTCGCTTSNVATDPIPPGSKSEITVAFNSTGKMGMQNKTVTVISNAPGQNKVSFTANVLPKKAAGGADPR